MVHQSAFALSAEQRKCLEEGGGTKEATKVLRETYGGNFEQYILSREEEWCRQPHRSRHCPRKPGWTPPAKGVAKGGKGGKHK